MIGSMSLLVTFLPLATLVTPAGARNGSRGRPSGFCRVGTCGVCGVRSENGFGSWIGSGCSSPVAGAWARSVTGRSSAASAGTAIVLCMPRLLPRFSSAERRAIRPPSGEGGAVHLERGVRPAELGDGVLRQHHEGGRQALRDRS